MGQFWCKFKSIVFYDILSTRFFRTNWNIVVNNSLSLRFCFLWFSIFWVVGHLTFYHIYFNYINFGQRVHDFLYTRQGASNYICIHAIENSLRHARIGIFNLNRTCMKKVPRLSLRKYHFSVLFFQFPFF